VYRNGNGTLVPPYVVGEVEKALNDPALCRLIYKRVVAALRRDEGMSPEALRKTGLAGCIMSSPADAATFLRPAGYYMAGPEE
jgi:hypothetical protein